MVRAQAYETALDLYWTRNFGQARDLFAAIDDDPPSRVMRDRCDVMLLHRPPEEWNGIYLATSK
jgi:hypothetical protein